MSLEMMRTFPVPRQRGWDLTEDLSKWPEWLDLEVADPETAARENPGDAVEVVGRMLGLKFKGTLILEEKVAPEMSRTLWRWRGWPDVSMEFHYTEAGPGAFTVRVVASVDEEAGLLAKSFVRLSMTLPFMMQRQVRLTFDRLDALFRREAAGEEEKEEVEAPAADTD